MFGVILTQYAFSNVTAREKAESLLKACSPINRLVLLFMSNNACNRLYDTFIVCT